MIKEYEFMDFKKGDVVEIIADASRKKDTRVGQQAIVLRKGASNWVWIKVIGTNEDELAYVKSRLRKI